MTLHMEVNHDTIRKLRGSLTRRDFSKRVGVTELTVYRWELPEGSREARRPRGRVLQALLREFGEANAGSPAAPLDSAELALLLPLLEQFLRVEWKRCEEQLL